MVRSLNSLAVILLIAIAGLIGGKPWFLLCLMTVIALHICGNQHFSTLASISPSFLWLGLHLVTNNRELFFPYTMYLSSFTALVYFERGFWHGIIGGIFVVSGFLIIRIRQSAADSVLLLEFGVALAILAVAVLAVSASPKNIASRASILGFLSLAL